MFGGCEQGVGKVATEDTFWNIWMGRKMGIPLTIKRRPTTKIRIDHSTNSGPKIINELHNTIMNVTRYAVGFSVRLSTVIGRLE